MLKDLPNPPKIFSSGNLVPRGKAKMFISTEHHLVSILCLIPLALAGPKVLILPSKHT